jgi:hypothetical protein
MKVPVRRSERGQALAEAALYAALVALLALGLLSWIPVHRARTAATAAAHGCAQFLSQSPNPAWAAWQARQAAQATLEGDWSATLGTAYQVWVAPPQGPGAPGGCAVYYRPPRLFGLAGPAEPKASMEFFISRSEAWKARWR